MAAKFVLLFIFCVVNGVSMGEASHKVPASSLSPWYCQRLVPAFITAAVTPCTYPCLFLSPHEHPRIVVHPEREGTPCRITTGVGHHYEVGKCEGNVCRPPLPHIPLKRKKRFICLYAFVKWIKAKKKLAELKAMIAKLEKEVAAASSIAGPAAGTVGISQTGSAPGGALNVGNGGTSFGATRTSGGLGVVGTSGSPGRNPAIVNFGNVNDNIPPGMADGLGLGHLGNTGAGIGTPETVFGLPGEHGRRRGSAISGSSLSNIGIIGGGVSGIGDNGAGRTGGSGISGINIGAIGISGDSNTVVSPDGVRSVNIGAVGSSTSDTTSSRRVSSFNNAGSSSVHAIGIAASSSAATGNTSPSGNNGAGGSTGATVGSNIVFSAVRS